jgi:NTE family protein
MKVLQREGIPIDMVVACSGGAFCGLWVANGGGDADAEVTRFVRGWAGAFDRLSYKAIAQAFFPRLFGFNAKLGFMDDGALNRSIRDYVGERRFENLKVPLHLVATDFITGEKVVMSSGSLFDSVRATVSIPLILPPWEINGRRLVDGAVCDPLPIDIAVREGADVIIAMGFEESLQTSIQSGMGLLMQLKSVIVNHLYRSQYAFYNLSHHAEVVPIIPDIDIPVGLRDLHLVPQLIALGERAAEGEVAYLRRLMIPAKAEVQ